jgi:hypothetical protein
MTLIMIGVMSSCYHICPTNVTFQFDTTYMYALAILMVMTLYKSRHPDLAPDVISAFFLLALAVTLGVGCLLPALHPSLLRPCRVTSPPKCPGGLLGFPSR